MISKSFANSINKSILGGADYTPPTKWYFGISTKDLNDGALDGGEPTNTGYSRAELDNNSTTFSEPTSDLEHTLSYVKNLIPITMSEITGGADFTATHFFLSSSRTGNTAEIWGTFEKPRKMTADSQLIIKAGGAIFELLNA